MRAYADTSFLVKLITDEPGSEAAMAEFRRLDFPRLFFLPLHGLEVANAIRHRVFHLRRSAGRAVNAPRLRASAMPPWRALHDGLSGAG